MDASIFKVILDIANARKLNIGLFLPDGDNAFKAYPKKKGGIVFNNGSTLYVLENIRTFKDCFYVSGLEFDLVWIHKSKEFCNDSISYLSKHARSCTREMSKPSVVLT